MQDLKTIFRHCTRVMEQDGVYTPVRFSDERLRVYREEKPECPYACCPVGMSMEFKTDAEKISFTPKDIVVHEREINSNLYFITQGVWRATSTKTACLCAPFASQTDLKAGR